MERDNEFLQSASWTVRDARLSDADSIVRMVGKLAAHHNDVAALTPADLARDAFGEQPWIYLLVAEADEELVGYAALCGLIRLQFGARGLDMHHLFVETRLRGLGVGRSLVDACKVKARTLSCRYLMVGTHPDNNAAQAFYESLGFARGDSRFPRFSAQIDS